MSIHILGLETSCDETACAIVKDGREILSNTIDSQIQLHQDYGGVVPEIASRMHIEKISMVVDQALQEAGLDFSQIDGVGVTYGPGLVGALLCGVSYGKSLAYALNKPLIPVHHIKGHIAANYLTHPQLDPPFLCLVVSGGHSHLIEVNSYYDYRILGKTRDDAAGEVFDKVGRVLGLPYPGGAKIDELSHQGNGESIQFPQARFENSYDFSFSGLKTAVINYIHRIRQKNPEFDAATFQEPVLWEKIEGNGVKQFQEIITKGDILASFTRAVVEALTYNTFLAVRERKDQKIALAGGVACNTHLRAALTQRGKEEGVEVFYPTPLLCTDNAAMIASMGYYLYQKQLFGGLDLNAVPTIDIEN